MPLSVCPRLSQHSPRFQSLHLLPVCYRCPSSYCPAGGSQSRWVCVWAMQAFKWTLLRDWQFLLQLQPTLDFISRSCEVLFPWRWNPGLCGFTWDWDCLLPRYPSRFLPTIRECGTACSATLCCHPLTAAIPCPLCPGSLFLPLLPVQMTMASLNP